MHNLLYEVFIFKFILLKSSFEKTKTPHLLVHSLKAG